MRALPLALILLLAACDAIEAARPSLQEAQQIPIVNIPPLDDHGDGLGTAFAVSTDGWWLTSRHVASACEIVALLAPDERPLIVKQVEVHETADLALLRTRNLYTPTRMAISRRSLAEAQQGAAIGFPRGRFAALPLRHAGPVSFAFTEADMPDGPGESWMAGERVIWNGGSGGPIVDEDGRVLGIVAAQSNDRRMIYAVPREIAARFLRQHDVSSAGGRLELTGDARDRYSALAADGLVRRVACQAVSAGFRPRPL